MGSAQLDLTTLELSHVNELQIPLEDPTRASGTNIGNKSMYENAFDDTIT